MCPLDQPPQLCPIMPVPKACKDSCLRAGEWLPWELRRWKEGIVRAVASPPYPSHCSFPWRPNWLLVGWAGTSPACSTISLFLHHPMFQLVSRRRSRRKPILPWLISCRWLSTSWTHVFWPAVAGALKALSNPFVAVDGGKATSGRCAAPYHGVFTMMHGSLVASAPFGMQALPRNL